MNRKTIIFYGTPAHGHVNASLYFIEQLSKTHKVIYYCSKDFESKIKEVGAEFRAYDIDLNTLSYGNQEVEFGNKPMISYRLCLYLNILVLDTLLFEANIIGPDLIIYDSIASWGKHVASISKVKHIAFHSFVTVNRYLNPSFFAYFFAFIPKILRQIYLLPSVLPLKRKLRKKYGLKNLSFMDITLNKGKYNIFSFNRLLQPGGKSFNPTNLFIGPTTLKRRNDSTKDDLDYEKMNALIYISLGTMVRDQRILQKIMNTLKDTPYQFVISTGISDIKGLTIPKNFILRSSVNQLEILKYAKVYVSTGGMNGLLESIEQNVPMIIYPTQGEKKINAKRIQKLGLGLYIKNLNHLKISIDKFFNQKLDKDLTEHLSQIDLTDALKLIEEM